jgi:hypothetical protein
MHLLGSDSHRETDTPTAENRLTPEVGGTDGRQSVTILAMVEEGYAGSSTDKIVPARLRFSSGQKSDSV